MSGTAVDRNTQSIDSDSIQTPSALTKLEILHRDNPYRLCTERFIAQQYHQIHNAKLEHFLPILLRVCQTNTTFGAIGVSPGHYRPMFLEQYIDVPIEQQMAAYTNQPFDRCTIAEVGNLAVSHSGYTTVLLVALATALYEAGYQWMAFTITTQVEKLIARLGFRPTFLINADPRKLGASKSNWGSYYEHHPKVMIGNLKEIARIARANPRLSILLEQHQKDIFDIAACLANHRRVVST